MGRGEAPSAPTQDASFFFSGYRRSGRANRQLRRLDAVHRRLEHLESDRFEFVATSSYSKLSDPPRRATLKEAYEWAVGHQVEAGSPDALLVGILRKMSNAEGRIDLPKYAEPIRKIALWSSQPDSPVTYGSELQIRVANWVVQQTLTIHGLDGRANLKQRLQNVCDAHKDVFDDDGANTPFLNLVTYQTVGCVAHALADYSDDVGEAGRLDEDHWDLLRLSKRAVYAHYYRCLYQDGSVLEANKESVRRSVEAIRYDLMQRQLPDFAAVPDA